LVTPVALLPPGLVTPVALLLPGPLAAEPLFDGCAKIHVGAAAAAEPASAKDVAARPAPTRAASLFTFNSFG